MRSKHATSLQPGRVAADADNAGAVIYGPYEFSAKSEAQFFVTWLIKNSHPYGSILSKWAAGSREFSAAWMYLGANDPQGFMELQTVFRYSVQSCAC